MVILFIVFCLAVVAILYTVITLLFGSKMYFRIVEEIPFKYTLQLKRKPWGYITVNTFDSVAAAKEEIQKIKNTYPKIVHEENH